GAGSGAPGGRRGEPADHPTAPDVGGDPARRRRRLPARRDRGLARPAGPDRSPVRGGGPAAPAPRTPRRLPPHDIFLPMTYYTYRVKGPRAAAWYTAQIVQIIRQQTSGMQVPIHVVGGISFDPTGPETQGFVHTVLERDVIGASYYTFPGITLDQWKALSALR